MHIKIFLTAFFVKFNNRITYLVCQVCKDLIEFVDLESNLNRFKQKVANVPNKIFKLVFKKYDVF